MEIYSTPIQQSLYFAAGRGAMCVLGSSGMVPQGAVSSSL